jgi:chaperonin GroES
MKDKIKNIIPLADRVLIEPLKEKEKTISGIYLPETIDKEKPEKGKVLAVGEGRREEGKLIPLKVKVNDLVIFSKYGYDEIKVGDKEYLILKEDNILAIIK